jgi:hypothetical protein
MRNRPRFGDDHTQTPDARARAVVEHFLPCGRIAQPSSGNGAFLRALLRGADWFEIQKRRDFLKAEGRWDWAVGNPPFSQFRVFLQKAMQVADNLVLIGLAPAWFVRARQEDMRQARTRRAASLGRWKIRCGPLAGENLWLTRNLLCCD